MELDGYNQRFTEKDRLDRMHERHYGGTVDLLRQLTKRQSILDVGCGLKGSLGFLGAEGLNPDSEHGGPMWYAEGLDEDRKNESARYHSWAEVKGPFDTALFCHMLEHLPGEYPEALEQLRSASLVAKQFIIVAPNGGHNHFVHQRTQDGTHTCAPYNIVDFSVLLEENGFKVERLIRSGIKGYIGQHLKTRVWVARFLYAWTFGTSPFYDYVIVCRRRKNDE